MIMADVLTWFLLIAGTIIVLNSYWLASASLWPSLVERCEQKYERPFRLAFTGLCAAIPFVFLAVLFHKLRHPAGNLLTFVSIGVPVLIGMAGSAGLALRVGKGLISPVDEKQPWRRVLRGGIVVAFTMLLPFIGWFVLLPCTLMSGFGAATLVWREHRKTVGQTVPTAASPAVAPLLATGEVGTSESK
jgi:hypothetical protein